jgi:excisionase family DNA binding protein
MLGFGGVDVPRIVYQPPEGYLTLGQAQMRLQVSKAKIIRMAQDGSLPTYRDPRDKRYRLAKVEDVDRLTQLVPAE